MDANTVIQMGQNITLPNKLDTFIVFGIVLVFLILVGTIIIFNSKNKKMFSIGYVFIAISIVLGICGPLLIRNNNLQVYYEEVYDWKENVVHPYVQSLPTERKEISYVSIASEVSSDEIAKFPYTYGYTSVASKLPLTVAFEEVEMIVMLNNWYDVSMDLTEDDEPYVEFKRVLFDLGHGVDSGYYNLIVHLPSGYKFNSGNFNIREYK